MLCKHNFNLFLQSRNSMGLIWIYFYFFLIKKYNWIWMLNNLLWLSLNFWWGHDRNLMKYFCRIIVHHKTLNIIGKKKFWCIILKKRKIINFKLFKVKTVWAKINWDFFNACILKNLNESIHIRLLITSVKWNNYNLQRLTKSREGNAMCKSILYSWHRKPENLYKCWNLYKWLVKRIFFSF